MIDVIQIFKSVERIKKQDYLTETRQLLDHWGGHFVSKSGYLKNQMLYLPTDAGQGLSLKTTGLVIIQDSRNNDLPSETRQLICFNQPARHGSFELFKIEKNGSCIFNLHLNYSANEFLIGIPRRDDHKIAELKLNEPIRYRINGKSDFTMSGRQQRTFVEFDYIFEYLGKADKIELKDLNKIEINKTIPADICKLVDERKILK